MAKRRVNKNLVAFLTAAGILLAVIVVAIGAINKARRDPAAIAEKAAVLEQSDDPRARRRALELYKSAADKSTSPSEKAQYLIEAARCAREMGELSEMLGLLRVAPAQSPNDPAVLSTLLTRYWEIRDYPFLIAWRDLLEYAESLLELQSESVLALVWKSEALEHLKNEDPANAAEADAALSRAVEIDPTSPYVARVRAERERTRADEEARELLRSGDQAAAEALRQQACVRQVEFLRPAVAEHPDDVALRIALAQALADADQWEASRAALDAGLAESPDDADLHFALANLLLQSVRLKMRAATEDVRARMGEAEAEELRTQIEEEVIAAIDAGLLAEGLQCVNRAIELEPALYSGYTLRSELQRLSFIKDGRWKSDPRACQRDVLESFAAALRDTVGLRSFRAALSQGQRLIMIATAFNDALAFYRTARDEAVKSQALTYLRRFLQEVETQYPKHALASLMNGHVAAIDGDDRLAAKAFREADERDDTGLFSRPAREELIRVYRRLGELGSSLEYTVRLINWNVQEQRPVPPWLYWNEAEVLLALGRAQEALDLLDSIATQYAGDRAWKDIYVRVLAVLGRGEEAAPLLAEASPGDERNLFLRAGIAEHDEDYATAERLLRQLLEVSPRDILTIRRLIGAMVADGRPEDALRFVQEQLATAEEEKLRRFLRTREVILSVSDPVERDDKLIQIFGEIPNDFERAREFFSFWAAQNDIERAVTYLDRMEELKPDDADVLRMQLDLALRREKCERAARYVKTLAELNADNVGGATFRGKYELACGSVETALSEFRAAEREFPSDSRLKVNIAEALLRLKPPRYAEAIQALKQAVEFDPRNFLAHRWLFQCYEQIGRREEGIPHLEAAAELAARLRVEDSYIKARAQLLEEEKNPQQGIQNREKLRAEKPDDVANLIRLAELYARTGDDVRAEERLRAAAQLDPASLQVAGFGARFFGQRGKREAGEELLRQHLAAQEGLGEIFARVLLGNFYETLDDQETALGAYQRAQERAGELFAAGSEDRRRAMILSASELAEYYRRKERFDDMIEAYRAVLSQVQPSELTQIRAARQYIIGGLMSLRRYGEAGEEIADYRRQFPDDPLGMMAEAELLVKNNKLDEAAQKLTQILEIQPNNAWSRYMRALVYIEQGRNRYPNALDDLVRVKQIAPQAFNLKHRLLLARLRELMEKPELAEAELRELLAIDRGASRVVELQLIDLLARTDQFGKAQEFVNELMATDPEEPLWPYKLGRLLMARGQASAAAAKRLEAERDTTGAAAERRKSQGEYSEAARQLQRAVALTEGKRPGVIAEWLFALTHGNRAGEAITMYERLRERAPDALTPLIQASAAEAYLEEKRPDEGIAVLEQGVSTGSRRSVGEVRAVVDHATDLLGRDETLALLRRVLERTDDPTAKLVLRSTLAMQLAADATGRAEGLELARALLEAVPSGSPLHLEALLVQAIALEHEGQYEQVAKLYEELVGLAPNNPAVLNNLAYLLADKLDRVDEALIYAQRLHDLAPDSAVILDTVGWVYYKNGQVDQADAVFSEALRIDPRNLAARYHLGQVYADNGQETAARRAFRRVLELARERQNEEYEKKAEEALENLR
jgi:predicted Zn-dependent protease